MSDRTFHAWIVLPVKTEDGGHHSFWETLNAPSRPVARDRLAAVYPSATTIGVLFDTEYEGRAQYEGRRAFGRDRSRTIKVEPHGL